MTVIFNSKDVEIIFKNVDDFNKFWYYDSGGTCNFEGDSISSWKAFHRQDGSFHRPQSETINGETWFVNDGKQPVGDDVMVDMLRRDGIILCDEPAVGRNWIISSVDAPCSYDFHITHWRLAK